MSGAEESVVCAQLDGIFAACMCGLVLGVLYDVSIPAMVAVSVAAQLAAIPLYLRSARLHRDGLKGENT